MVRSTGWPGASENGAQFILWVVGCDGLRGGTFRNSKAISAWRDPLYMTETPTANLSLLRERYGSQEASKYLIKAMHLADSEYAFIFDRVTSPQLADMLFG